MTAQAITKIDEEIAQLSARQAKLQANKDKIEAEPIVEKLLQTVSENLYEDYKTLREMRDATLGVKQAIVNLLFKEARKKNKDAQFLLSEISKRRDSDVKIPKGKWLETAAKNGSVQAYAKLAEEHREYARWSGSSEETNRKAAVYTLLAGDLTKVFESSDFQTRSVDGQMTLVFNEVATAEQIAQLRQMVGLPPEVPNPK